MTKYKLTNETIKIDNIILYRIELIEDCKWGNKGDKGGYIEKIENLYGDAWVSGDAWVFGNARVYDNARVFGDAWVSGDARVSGNARVYDNAMVSGDARVSGDAWVFGNARVYDNAMVFGDARVSGDAWVFGNARVYDNARVFGDAWEVPPLQIQGSRHYFNICKYGYIKIGCIEKSIDEWEREFEIIGKENNYTELQIKEYGLYIQLAKQLYNK